MRRFLAVVVLATACTSTARPTTASDSITSNPPSAPSCSAAIDPTSDRSSLETALGTSYFIVVACGDGYAEVLAGQELRPMMLRGAPGNGWTTVASDAGCTAHGFKQPPGLEAACSAVMAPHPPPHLLDGGGLNSLSLSFGDGAGTERLDAVVVLASAGAIDRDFTVDGRNVRANLTRGSHLDELYPEPSPTISPHPAVVTSAASALNGTIHITATLIDPSAPADCNNLRTTAVLTDLRFTDGTTIDRLTAHTDLFGCYAA